MTAGVRPAHLPKVGVPTRLRVGARTVEKLTKHRKLEDDRMDRKYATLSEGGYEIVSVAGSYCCVCRDGKDIILRWNGEGWQTL